MSTMPKARAKSLQEEQAEEEMEETTLHGVINEDKARLHMETLDAIMENMAREVQKEVPEVMVNAIKSFKQAIGKVLPGTEEANTTAVLKAVCDPTCLAICPHTEDTEEKLEELMLEENILEGEEVISRIENVESLMDGQKENIGELFENMKVTHESLAWSCDLLGMLSQSLTSRQLLLLMRTSIHPLVQVNTLAGFMEEPSTSRKKVDLLESKPKRVKIMMILDPASKTIKKEKLNSLIHLLAATFAYKILYKFADRVTQHKIQEMYFVRPKQMSAYITGRKYLGGTDRKAWARKCKTSRNDEEPSMSKKTATE